MNVGMSIETDHRSNMEECRIRPARGGVGRVWFWIAHAALAGIAVLCVSLRPLAYVGLLAVIIFESWLVSTYRRNIGAYAICVFSLSLFFWAPIFVFALDPNLQFNDIVFYPLVTLIVVGLSALLVSIVIPSDSI